MLSPIETPRLILRPFELKDITPAYEMNLDEDVNEFTGDGGVVSREEIERRIKEDVLGDYSKYGYGRMAVEVKDGPSFIGFCGLKYLDDLNEVDLGFRFMKKYWGKGYATESGKASLEFGFHTLDLSSICAMVLPQNKRSVHVLEKLQFKFEKKIQEDDLIADFYRLLK